MFEHLLDAVIPDVRVHDFLAMGTDLQKDMSDYSHTYCMSRPSLAITATPIHPITIKYSTPLQEL